MPAPKKPKPPKEPKSRGPEPQRTKIDMPWEEAAKKAIRTPRPAGGWPKSEPEPKEGESGKKKGPPTQVGGP